MKVPLSFIILLFSWCQADVSIQKQNLKFKNKSIVRPPCKACVVLTDSFRNGMEKTTRGKYEGGDAAWEEEKLGNYENSEIRLTEIQEILCTDIDRGQDQCHSLASDNEHLLEEWWFNYQSDHPDIFDWLCIDQLKVCCPPNHYGPTCELCADCNGNGKCKGNGTRKGNGECLCDTGYSGKFCDDCDIQYYVAFRDDNKLLCSECHASCGNNGCTGSGPTNCRSCKHGWIMVPDTGCVDVNECIETSNVCNKNQFCVNNEGSYTCLDCDKSCNGCEADGPDMCKECADGYELRDGKCIDLINEKRGQYVSFTRFLTYLGLCIATCVIFQNSTSIACAVGIAVAIYISLSEYWLHSSPSLSNSLVDTKQIEDLIKGSL